MTVYQAKKVNSSNAIFGVAPSTNIIFILHKAKTWDKSLQNKMKSLANISFFFAKNISLIYITIVLVIN